MNQQQRNYAKWGAIYAAAAIAKEPLQDVVVETVKSIYIKLVYNAAADLLYKNGFNLTKQAIDSAVKTIIETKNVSVRQCVIINQQGITVNVDAPNVENVDITFKALEMLSTALDQ